MIEPMVFESLEPIMVPVKIGTEWYALKEASGEAARKYQNALLSGASLGVDGRTSSLELDKLALGLDKLADIEPLLVSECLFHAVYDVVANRIVSVGTLVGYSVIIEWPGKIISRLYAKVKEISELGTIAEDPNKNPTLASGPKPIVVG